MTTNTMLRSGSPKDRFTLKQRLRLHTCLQAIEKGLGTCQYLFMIMACCGMLIAGLADRNSSSLLSLFFVLPYMASLPVIIISIILRRKNIVRIAAFDDIAAVAPLLDFADSTFLDTQDTSNTPKPKSEALVLSHLPDLLARMPAGDGPALIPRQRSTLTRLYLSSRYQQYFPPELCAKIDTIVNHTRKANTPYSNSY